MNQVATGAAASIEDELEIRKLIEAFGVAVMRLDADRFVQVFAKAGSWKLPSLAEPARGRSTIAATFKEKMAYVRFISMSAFPAELKVEGERASAKTYCQELIFPKAGGQRIVAGCFDDQFVREGGKWLFAARTYEVLGIDPPPAT